MIELIEQTDGNLLIKIVDKEEFLELLEKGYTDERHPLWDMLEDARYIGNNWYVLMDLALTEIPCIAKGSIYANDDSESPDDYEFYWGYPNYMIWDYLAILKEEGQVVFTKMN